MDSEQQWQLIELLHDLIKSCYDTSLWKDTGWEHRCTRGGFSGSGCIVTKGAIQLQLEERTGPWHIDFDIHVFGFIPDKTELFHSNIRSGKERQIYTAKDGYWVHWLLLQLDIVMARRDKLRLIRERMKSIKQAQLTIPVDDSEYFHAKKQETEQS